MAVYNYAKQANKVAVLGRLPFTEAADSSLGYMTISAALDAAMLLPGSREGAVGLSKDLKWDLGKQDAFIQGLIDRNAPIYFMTQPYNESLQPTRWGPAVLEREVKQLQAAGYVEQGDLWQKR